MAEQQEAGGAWGGAKVNDSLSFPTDRVSSILGPAGATIKQAREGGADVILKKLQDHVEVHFSGTWEQVEAAKAMVSSAAQGQEAAGGGGSWGGGDWGQEAGGGDWGGGGAAWGGGGGQDKWPEGGGGASGDGDWGGGSGGGGWNEWGGGKAWSGGDDWGKGGDWGGGGQGNGSSQGEEGNETLKLELSAFGSIVGPGGAKIKDVRAQSGAVVQIEKLSDRVEVKISGPAEKVAKAKAMVLDLASGGGPPSAPAERTETLTFDKSLMGGIIGHGGKRINQVRKQTGAEVAMKKVEDHCEVTISGSNAQVGEALALVNRMAEAVRNGESPDSIVGTSAGGGDGGEPQSDDEETMELSRHDAKKVIGRAGAVIQKIRKDSGAAVEINDKSDPCPVRISGNKKTVDRARCMIYDVMQGSGRRGDRDKMEWEDEAFLKITYDASKKLIGKAGARIQELQQKSWAKIEVGKSTGEPVMVRVVGSFDAVEQACSMIEEAVPDCFQRKRPRLEASS